MIQLALFCEQSPRNPSDGEEVIYRKCFWHKRANKMIYAPPGKAFRIVIRKK